MITIEVFNEQIVEQPGKPSTLKEEGEIKQKKVKFSLLNLLSRGRHNSTRSKNNIRIYQDGEWNEDIKR